MVGCDLLLTGKRLAANRFYHERPQSAAGTDDVVARVGGLPWGCAAARGARVGHIVVGARVEWPARAGGTGRRARTVGVATTFGRVRPGHWALLGRHLVAHLLGRDDGLRGLVGAGLHRVGGRTVPLARAVRHPAHAP